MPDHTPHFEGSWTDLIHAVKEVTTMARNGEFTKKAFGDELAFALGTANALRPDDTEDPQPVFAAGPEPSTIEACCNELDECCVDEENAVGFNPFTAIKIISILIQLAKLIKG